MHQYNVYLLAGKATDELITYAKIKRRVPYIIMLLAPGTDPGFAKGGITASA